MVVIMWIHSTMPATDKGAGVLILFVPPLQRPEPDKFGLPQWT